NTSNPYHGARRAGSVGPALEGVEVIVTDPQTGAPLDRGQTGMIEVRGPNVFKGYWKMPEKTAEELRNTGFLITGDLGHIDIDGYVHIVGRQKDLIISGGYNIYPKEVELLLDDQSGVRESAVIGVPHPDFGEAVVAVIVPDGTEPLSIEALMTVASRKLANYKRPKKIIVLKALPRNTMGKVQKNVLRAQNQDIFKPPQ
ncbi:MAG: malonyl-CoA/methylmalonyl-CoA synthetase, partial [Paracoccaceae bacterium]